MADRAKTLLSSSPSVSVATASSDAGGSYVPANAQDRQVDSGSGGVSTWLASGSPPSFPQWLRFDFGASKTFDSCLIATPGAWLSGAIRNGLIEYSDNDTDWTTAATITDLYGAQPTVHKFAAVTWAAASGRYWRLTINSQWASNYCGTAEWLLFNSANIGARLDNAGGFVLTAPGTAVASATELSDRDFSTYGLHYSRSSNAAGDTFEIDLGSAQYIGGMDVVAYNVSAYWPSRIYIFTSNDGSTWTFREIVSLPAWVSGIWHPLTFSRIYQTRYCKFFVINDTTGSIWFEWFIYATLTPAAPPNPTSVTARASDTGTDIELTWSEAAGDDNLLADLVYKVERQKDGGGWSTLTSTHPVTHYVDTSLAAGDYDYRVTAINSYHARESSAVQTAASVTSPAAAGGGGSVFGGGVVR